MRLGWIARSSLLLAIALTGCAATNTSTESPSLEGSAWVLASLPGRSLVPDSTPTSQFADGHVTGSDGCNQYSMPFTERGLMIEIGPQGATTQMACTEGVMAQADAFTNALRTAHGFRRSAETLELLAENGDVLATFAAQTSSLAGTSWNVVNINNGRQAVVGLVQGSTVTIEFDTAGRVSGTTGCNQFTADYTVEGDLLRFSSVAATLQVCSDPSVDEQEHAFLRALDSAVILSFVGDRLDLRKSDGALALILVRDHSSGRH